MSHHRLLHDDAIRCAKCSEWSQAAVRNDDQLCLICEARQRRKAGK